MANHRGTMFDACERLVSVLFRRRLYCADSFPCRHEKLCGRDNDYFELPTLWHIYLIEYSAPFWNGYVGHMYVSTFVLTQWAKWRIRRKDSKMLIMSCLIKWPFLCQQLESRLDAFNVWDVIVDWCKNGTQKSRRQKRHSNVFFQSSPDELPRKCVPVNLRRPLLLLDAIKSYI